MDLRTQPPPVILAGVEELAGRLLQALDLRHGRQVGPLTPFAAVLHVAFLVALGDVAEPCLEQIPRPQLQKHAGELCVHRADWMPWNYRDTLARQTAPLTRADLRPPEPTAGTTNSKILQACRNVTKLPGHLVDPYVSLDCGQQEQAVRRDVHGVHIS